METIRVITNPSIAPLDIESEEAAGKFLKEFVQKHSLLDERTKVAIFAQKLEGIYNNWYLVQNKETRNDWELLKSAFKAQFLKDERLELFDCKQRIGEKASAFYFRAIVLIQNSNIKFTDNEQAVFITSKLVKTVRIKVNVNNQLTLHKLKKKLVKIDAKFEYELGKKIAVVNKNSKISSAVSKSKKRCWICRRRGFTKSEPHKCKKNSL